MKASRMKQKLSASLSHWMAQVEGRLVLERKTLRVRLDSLVKRTEA